MLLIRVANTQKCDNAPKRFLGLDRSLQLFLPKRTYLRTDCAEYPLKSDARALPLWCTVQSPRRRQPACRIRGCPWRIYLEALELDFRPSRKLVVSRLRNSTSAGKPPPADACPVTVPGEIVTTRTFLIALAAACGSNSGLRRSFVPVRISVLALIEATH